MEKPPVPPPRYKRKVNKEMLSASVVADKNAQVLEEVANDLIKISEEIGVFDNETSAKTEIDQAEVESKKVASDDQLKGEYSSP